MKVLEKTTKFVNRHFQVGLSWKNDFPILQRNCEHAIQRFKYLKTWFLKNPEFFNMCRTQIGDYIISGQAKLLSLEKKHKTNSITSYILHHEVLYAKLHHGCVIFDASAKINKTYLILFSMRRVGEYKE